MDAAKHLCRTDTWNDRITDNPQIGNVQELGHHEGVMLMMGGVILLCGCDGSTAPAKLGS